jgi:hypothetical protein
VGGKSSSQTGRKGTVGFGAVRRTSGRSSAGGRFQRQTADLFTNLAAAKYRWPVGVGTEGLKSYDRFWVTA